MAKKLIKEIRPYVKLYRDTNNGIAWIEDGSTGLGISVHPNLGGMGDQLTLPGILISVH